MHGHVVVAASDTSHTTHISFFFQDPPAPALEQAPPALEQAPPALEQDPPAPAAALEQAPPALEQDPL